MEKTLGELKGKEYSVLKTKLSESLVEVVCPIGKEIKKLMSDKSYLEKIMQEGTVKAKKIANFNLNEIRNIVGLL